MLYVNVTYECKPGMREAFYKAIRENEIDEKCRKENGNVRYEFFYSIELPDRMFLVEAWESPEASAAHRETAHYFKLQELKKEYVADTAVVRMS